MTSRAYVLVQAEVGTVADVAAAVRAIPGVVSADGVTGPYDLIVVAEADSMDDVAKVVAGRIQAVAGIERTLTCPVVEL